MATQYRNRRDQLGDLAAARPILRTIGDRAIPSAPGVKTNPAFTPQPVSTTSTPATDAAATTTSTGTGGGLGSAISRIEQSRADREARRAERTAQREERQAGRLQDRLGGLGAGIADRLSGILADRDARKAARDAERAANQGGETGGAGGAGGTGGAGFDPTSVASRVDQLIDADSPLMQRAAAKGTMTANRRGLGNSTMAIEAGQAAVLDAAVPIASQDASLSMQDRLSQREDARIRSIAQMEDKRMRDLQGAELASREKLATQEVEAKQSMLEAELAQRERDNLASTIAQVNSTRLQAMSNTLVNPDIPASARAEVQRSINDQAQQTVNYLQNIYGVSVSGTTPTTAYAPTSPYADYYAAQAVYA